MTPDDITQMALKSGMAKEGENFFSPGHDEIDVHISDLTRFAQAAREAGIATERLRCAQIAARYHVPMCDGVADAIHAEILAGGQP